MNSDSKETMKQKPGELSLAPVISLENFPKYLTKLELINKNIVSASLEKLDLPENLEILILSQNNLTELPESVTNLKKLKKLDLSCNNIGFFNETPVFTKSIEYLNLSNNNLKGPPYWVWTENPPNLRHLNLSVNKDITSSLTDSYFQELLLYTSLVTQLDIYNCRLQYYLELIGTFCQLEILNLGASDFSLAKVNFIEKFPNRELEKCCNVQVIDLRNTNIYTIDTNINKYRNLTDINLSFNNISYLPSQFCDLKKLESCVLSFNELLYLPDGFEKLKNLKKLYLDHNQLCTLPENLSDLKKLVTLDLYCNHLYEVPQIQHVVEIDFAQNYSDEPEDSVYKIKKEKLRKKLELTEKRLDGRAAEEVSREEEHSETRSSDEWNDDEEETKDILAVSMEEEDWDSDEYWVPHPPRPHIPLESPWVCFVKQKLREGNFCPSDMHAMSVADKVKYEKMGKPKFSFEVIGQFDDLSDESS